MAAGPPFVLAVRVLYVQPVLGDVEEEVVGVGALVHRRVFGRYFRGWGRLLGLSIFVFFSPPAGGKIEARHDPQADACHGYVPLL